MTATVGLWFPRSRPSPGMIAAEHPTARLIPRHPLGGELIEVILPVARLVATELEQVIPAEYPGRMHVVEGQPRRVVSDRIDFEDRHLALAGHGLALFGGVALHLGA